MAEAFDRVIMVDWSGGRDRGPRPKPDAIFAAVAGRDADEVPVYLRNRAVAEAWLIARIGAGLAANERLLVGFDFPFGYPAGFARALTGQEDVLALWDWFATRIRDAAVPARAGPMGHNNRFDVAGAINIELGLDQGRGVGPFWGNGLKRDVPGLPRKGTARTFRWNPARRAVERRAPGAFECWQMSGAGSVGGQAMMGLPVLARLRARFGADLAVAPFEAATAAVMLAEIWPSLISHTVAQARRPGEIRDAAQVRVLARAVAALPCAQLAAMLIEGRDAGAEGWILGLGHEAELASAFASVPTGAVP